MDPADEDRLAATAVTLALDMREDLAAAHRTVRYASREELEQLVCTLAAALPVDIPWSQLAWWRTASSADVRSNVAGTVAVTGVSAGADVISTGRVDTTTTESGPGGAGNTVIPGLTPQEGLAVHSMCSVASVSARSRRTRISPSHEAR